MCSSFTCPTSGVRRDHESIDEQDLASHFAPFGNLVSTRIMTDKNTGRNKGYGSARPADAIGFASYDNPQSAQKAVVVMNGFSVLGKRLKVELKKGDDGLDTSILGSVRGSV